VRSADLKLDRYLLARSVRLDRVLVVVVLEPLAEPEVTLGSVVVTLLSSDLELTLDVTVVVALLVVVDLLTTICLEGSTWQTGLRGCDESVTLDSGSNQAEDGDSRGSVFHFGDVRLKDSIDED
jgi:hypothetical protein